MSLAKKLNLKPGMKMRVIGKPAGVELDDVPVTTSTVADAVLAFATTLDEVSACTAFVAAAQIDRIAWLAYPKAGQLGTDINRDVLNQHLLERGIQAVRQIAIDPVWSAMRFRPKSER